MPAKSLPGKAMTDKIPEGYRLAVDRSLVAMFLKMTPEERLTANDKAVGAIRELRDAYRQWKNHPGGPGRSD